MTDSFTDKPDLAPYTAITPTQSLTELNTTRSAMARESAQMDFTDADEAPETALNEAIWKSVKGTRSRIPAPRHALGR